VSPLSESLTIFKDWPRLNEGQRPSDGENYMPSNLKDSEIRAWNLASDRGAHDRSVPGLGNEVVRTIDATAFGTSTQLGRNFGVKIIITNSPDP